MSFQATVLPPERESNVCVGPAAAAIKAEVGCALHLGDDLDTLSRVLHRSAVTANQRVMGGVSKGQTLPWLRMVLQITRPL